MRNMEYTPVSKVYPVYCKDQNAYDCCDSGYSGLFHSPRSISGVDLQSLSPVEFNETPKENVRLTVSSKERNKETQQAPAISWCETPKLHKRDASLRHRLLTCKPSTDVDSTRLTCMKNTDASISSRSKHCSSASFDSQDAVTVAFASSTLRPDQDLPLSSRKRRFLFSHIRTSTLVDGKSSTGKNTPAFEREALLSEADFSKSNSTSDETSIETPQSRKFLPASSKEYLQSPDNLTSSGFNDVFSTPSATQTPKCVRSVSEDSGFGSLALDKSQDSSVDHDGSFQDLLFSASKTHCETPITADLKRRPRLQRQHRLSTLKEGGSQSEEEPTNRNNEHFRQSLSKDVQTEGATPRQSFSVKCRNGTTPDGLIHAKQGHATPTVCHSGKPDHTTSVSSASPANGDVTPLKTTPADLSLTPALQLVQAMFQRKVQVFSGQSPSLSEQLKYATALAETPVMLRTTMPLAGLIGRKMGLGRIDILKELKKRNLRHILAAILGYLTPENIYNCGLVSKNWNEIIMQNREAATRRRSYLSEMKASLELGDTPHVPDAETRLTLIRRSALKMVQSQSRNSSFCTPLSGGNRSAQLQHSTSRSGSNSKREKFVEIAKTLFIDECLKPCPRCEHPARCHSVKGEGVCSREDCGFQFCTSCLCGFHGSRECTSRFGSRRKTDIILPGSAQSRRNVKRL